MRYRILNRWTPCKRRDFLTKLRNLGFEGPYSGSRHQFMVYKEHRLAIPSNTEYSVEELKMMIREVENIIQEKISLERWQNL